MSVVELELFALNISVYGFDLILQEAVQWVLDLLRELRE